MRNLKIIFLLFVTSLIAMGQLRYDQVRIWTDNTSQTLQELMAFSLDWESVEVRRNVYLDLAVSERERMALETAGFQVEDLIVDLADHYQRSLEAASAREFGLGSMGGYYTFDEVIASMDSLHANYPQIVSQKDSIGVSYEGRTLWAFKISDNPGLDEDEPAVFFNSLIHAREPAGMMTVMYFAWQLVENYDTDDLLSYLVNEREIWFVPVINPDGYVFNELTNPQGGGMQRKNMRTDCTSLPGVDLNRNWGYQWGYDDVGSSPDPCDIDYRGSAPFSEPETQAIRDFVLAHDFSTVMNYHCYGNLLIRPFGYDAEAPLNNDDDAIYSLMGQDLTRDNHYLFGTGVETVHYATNGDAVDYMYGELGIINFTPEVGSGSQGGFWPAPDLVAGLAEENLSMNIHLAGVAGGWCRLLALDLQGETLLTPGMTRSIQIQVMNKGLNPSESGSMLTLTSPDNSIELEISQFDIAGMAAQEILMLEDSLTFQTEGSATLIASIQIANQYSVSDTFLWNVGLADTIWQDNFEQGADQWISEDWDVTRDAATGEFAYTESPLGDYPALSVVSTQLAGGIDLRGYQAAQLTFSAKWDIEIDYDFVQVLASTDSGSTWQAIEGLYTSPGNGATVQPVGEPGYHGNSDWVSESMSLDAFAENQDLRLKLQLLSDTWYEGDGFVLDNMIIKAWGIGFHPGDVTRDGLVDITDATLMLEWIVTQASLSAEMHELSDLNQDNLLDVRDLILMIELILNM